MSYLKFVLAFLLLSQIGLAQGSELTKCLRQLGVSAKDTSKFVESVEQAGACFREQLGKLPPGSPLPAPMEAVLDQAGTLAQRYHLSGAQTLELLGRVMVQVDPKMEAALPPLQQLKDLMARHKVPGPELYKFIEPGLKRGVQRRLTGDRPHPVGLKELNEAAAFAQRYNLPTAELVADLKSLRAAMQP